MKKNYILFIIYVIVMFFTVYSKVEASYHIYLPVFNNETRFTRGVKNTCYYVDYTASKYTKYINRAAKSWATLDNKIKNTAVASSKGTHIDFYAQNFPSQMGIVAYTSFFDDKGEQVNLGENDYDGPVKNYFYTDIIADSGQNSFLVDEAVMAHEMGHAYGLRHYQMTTETIMWPGVDVVPATTPQKVDNDAINYLYPNG